MADALQRIVYDVTIDDCTDVAIRFANRTKAFRNQFMSTVALGGALAGLSFTGALLLFGMAATGRGALLLLALGAVTGIVFAFTFLRGYFRKEILKQHRKVVAEQFAGKETLPCETELRSDSVWCRVGDIEMTFPWKICTSIQDNVDDIEINFSQGICVVRNRRFVSPADRQEFLETARRLSAKRD